MRVAVLVVLGMAAGGGALVAVTPDERDRERTVQTTVRTRVQTVELRSARRSRDVVRAVKAVARRLDVPVRLPAGLPRGVRLAGRPSADGSRAQISLRLPSRRVLTIQYGIAGFDGCGPLHPRLVRIGGHTGVIEIGKQFTSVVWPADIEHPDGRYGLSGDFPPRRMLRWARSMAQRSVSRAEAESGC